MNRPAAKMISLPAAPRPLAWQTLIAHWPEYLMEAVGLGVFMISACAFAVLLEHPDSPVHQLIDRSVLRRALMGVAMGLTAVGIIYSPWGKQSGAHLNPAVTFTFWRLGKIASWDALFYVVSQFMGGALGVELAVLAMGRWVMHPAINYVATVPGDFGAGVAFAGEAVIAFLLMTVVLTVSNTLRLARFTGLFAGTCVALFITFEAPLSGMSMNPARTAASALLAGQWSSAWIYFVAPLLGILGAATLFQRFRRAAACAKMHHHNGKRCIFCNHQNGTL